jgi:hypothetical protein
VVVGTYGCGSFFGPGVAHGRYTNSGWYGFRTGTLLVRLGGCDSADPEPEIRQQHATGERTVGLAYRERGVG